MDKFCHRAVIVRLKRAVGYALPLAESKNAHLSNAYKTFSDILSVCLFVRFCFLCCIDILNTLGVHFPQSSLPTLTLLHN